MKRFASVCAILVVSILVVNAAQASTITPSYASSSFAVSSTDIGETDATVSGVATWGGGSAIGSLSNLNARGTATAETTAGNGSLEFNIGAGVGLEPNYGNSVTYTFNTGTATLGWDISGITSFASWDSSSGGRSVQGYSVVATLMNASSVTVVSAGSHAVSGFAATKVDITGLGLTGVKSLTFSDFVGAPAGLGNIYHEIDIFGTATVPEPGTIVLLVTALLGLLAYAWRKKR